MGTVSQTNAITARRRPWNKGKADRTEATAADLSRGAIEAPGAWPAKSRGLGLDNLPQSL
jgi:hypothetical protein